MCSGLASTGGEFFAGYITEYSLSVDNLFVFVIIMARFAVPGDATRTRPPTSASWLSLLMRAVFIFAGAAAYRGGLCWTFYIFGAFLDLHRRTPGCWEG